MENISFENLLVDRSDSDRKGHSGRAIWKNIDKTACFYHVITKSNDGRTIFHSDSGEYRHNLLCRLCEERGITILFSMTMPNHTHDVFLTPSWEALVDVYRNLGMNITKYLRKKDSKKYKKEFRILRRYPIYIPVRDIVALFYLGKYIFDNPAYLASEKKFVPHSCFWMFEKNHFTTPYDAGIYEKLFGLTPQEMFTIFSTKSKEEVLAFAKAKYADWDNRKTAAVFFKPPSQYVPVQG